MSASIGAEARQRLLAEIRHHGELDQETGGFLLARAEDPDRLTCLALAADLGITRKRELFIVSGGALERLFTWATESEMRVRAQYHSHRRGAFLSPTDIEHGFSVEGFVTSVIPHYLAPPHGPDEWGWWRCSGGEWLRTTAPAVDERPTAVVAFDEEGVREL